MAPNDDPGDGSDAEDDDGVVGRVGGVHPLISPEDRVWRHPSEMSRIGTGQRDRRRRWTGRRTRFVIGTVAVAALSAGAVLAVARTLRIDVTGPERGATNHPVADVPPAAGPDTVAERFESIVATVRVRRAGAWNAGSATAYRSDGHFLTTARLVEGADEIFVTTADGRSSQAVLIGVDDHTDLAVLRIDRSSIRIVGSGTSAVVNAPVVALGRTGGDTTAVRGSIRQIDRREHSPAGIALYGLARTDFPLEAEMTGGVLVDGSGAVVGILNALTFRESAHLPPSAVVVPVKIAAGVADQIIENGTPQHAWMGIEISNVGASEAAEIGRGGVLVSAVREGGPADATGVRTGDIIVGIDDVETPSVAVVMAEMRRRRPGQSASVRIWRNGAMVTLEPELQGIP